MGAERAVVEMGVLIYPGAQMAAVHGLTDLFGVANLDDRSVAAGPRISDAGAISENDAHKASVAVASGIRRRRRAGRCGATVFMVASGMRWVVMGQAALSRSLLAGFPEPLRRR